MFKAGDDVVIYYPQGADWNGLDGVVLGAAISMWLRSDEPSYAVRVPKHPEGYPAMTNWPESCLKPACVVPATPEFDEYDQSEESDAG